MSVSEHPKTLVFFDGFCGLCNGLVDFLIRHDKLSQLQFAPLQGASALRLLTDQERTDLDSIVIIHEGRKLKESTAVLKTLDCLGGIWAILALVAFIFPESFRNLVYRLIARNRYRWFGKLDVCRIPTQEERSRFLD
jgi:predicted DCC family thiol-disulfide oxidoreductase YuxK